MNARLITLNVMAVAAVYWAWAMGYVQFAFGGDQSRMGYVIAVIVAASIAAAFAGRKAHLLRAAWLCETLGFTGTLIGITMGLSGAGDLSTTDGIIAAGNALYAGMATAFCSTLIGAAGMLWLWGVAQVMGASGDKA
jgi:hypothetical protein